MSFAISEHCLFDEQLDLLKSSTDHTYNCIAVSVSDNPPLLSGQNAHGGVVLFWKHVFDDHITPLTNIQSDRIVGIKRVFDDSNPLHILSVYLATSSHNDDEFLEYFDHMWALYDSLSVEGYVIVKGDCNGELGNSTLYNVCSVHRGVFNTSGDIMSTLRGYHEYIGGCSVHPGIS